MAPVRMTLRDAATALNTRPNTLRSAWKAGRLQGERANDGRIFVWVDPDAAPPASSKKRASNSSMEGPDSESNNELEAALKSHVATLLGQLAAANAELANLRPKAAEADELRVRCEALRELADTMKALLADRRAQPQVVEPRRRGLLGWLMAS